MYSNQINLSPVHHLNLEGEIWCSVSVHIVIEMFVLAKTLFNDHMSVPVCLPRGGPGPGPQSVGGHPRCHWSSQNVFP